MVNDGAIADVLEAAADDVFALGLLKGQYGYRGSERCAIGHIRTQTMGPYSPFHLDLYSPTCNALARHLGVKDWQIPIWNDNENTTAEDVREAYLQTAKEIRNGHA